MSRSRKGFKVDGVLLLDKPRGVSSAGAVNLTKFLYKAQKVGHTGTLDPLATGLLPLCFGEATKFSFFFLESKKTYEATIRFGLKTTTGDLEGEVIEERPTLFSRQDLEKVLEKFTGKIQQVPPMFSALKKEGVPLYELARKGKEVERKTREITVFSLQILSFETPFLSLRVNCSKGTYIRVLAEDIGEALGSCAHLTGLRRTAVGSFTIDQSIDLARLEELSPEQRLQRLLPVDCLLSTLAEAELDGETARKFMNGMAVEYRGATFLGDVAVYERTDSGKILLGVGFLEPTGNLKPKRLTNIEKDKKLCNDPSET